MVGERSSTEPEMKLTRRLLLPTPESPISKILNERSKPLPCPEDDPITQSQTKKKKKKTKGQKKGNKVPLFLYPFSGFPKKIQTKNSFALKSL